jgi:hypothetical protein
MVCNYSCPSNDSNWIGHMPAFSTTASSRVKAVALLAKSCTDVKLERSSCQTCMTSVMPVCVATYSLAACPLQRSRTAKMTSFAPRRTMCFAASLPSPVFAPVTMTVCPSKVDVGNGGWTASCERRKDKISEIVAPDIVSCMRFRGCFSLLSKASQPDLCASL